MKILSITLRNLASIEGTNHIDFTSGPLSKTGIYAISGSTGAGKSTILDAVCLALYDCTPRFSVPGENLYLQDVGDNQIHQNDVRNILRRGSGEGFAEVSFVGIDGHQYKSRWSVSRAKNDPTGPLMPQTVQVTNLHTGEEYVGTKDELLGRLVRITGLSYEQFTRTVLLAQNDFATFLKSTEGQKAELLEKLTGTEIYSQISRAIYIKNRSVHSEIIFLKQSIKQLEIISDEELQKMAIERDQLAPKRDYAHRQLLVLNEQLRIVTVFRQQQELLKQKGEEHDSFREAFDDLLQQKAKQQENYKAFRQYAESLQPELEQAAALDMNIQSFSERYRNQEDVCASISQRKITIAKSVADKEALFARELDLLNSDNEESSNEKLIELHKFVGKEKLLLDNLHSENKERIVQLNKYGISRLANELNAIYNELKSLLQKSVSEGADYDINEKLLSLNQRQEILIGQMNDYQALYDEWQSTVEDIRQRWLAYDKLKDSLSFCQLLLQDVNSEKEQLSSVSSIELEENARLATLEAKLNALRVERSQLLNGEVISDVQATLQMQENEIMQQIEITTKELDKCNSSLLFLDGEIKQLTITVKALEMEHQNIDNVNELPIVITRQKELIEEMDRRNAYIENKLLQQQENRITYKKLESDLEKKQEIAGKWEKLNWIIGSSDGLKFKIIAQSYTLNLLLLHANRHLTYLSSRYRLQQIPDTLALQVIDHEMCNEVRTIHSLSGGESFLISLALALGLSSLSSNNLKVESLFIDEGFGSLDNESLNTAMKALEQLYVQGRKIGVISHIQEMTERIPVKIHVEKTVNGKSRIEIIA